MKRFALLILLLIGSSMTGCASTTFGKHREASIVTPSGVYGAGLSDYYYYSGHSVSLHTNCGSDFPITFMLSPVIPLPPIIPVWFLGPSKSEFTLTLTGGGFSYSGAKMNYSRGTTTLSSSVKTMWNSPSVTKLTFEGDKCLEMSGTNVSFEGLTINGERIELPTFQYVVTSGGYFIDVQYLGQ